MTFRLRDPDIEYMQTLFGTEPTIEQMWLFGSRAKGTNQPGSDIDLALVGPAVSWQIKARIHAMLKEESPIPYFFDVAHWNTLTNENLKREVERTSVVIYSNIFK